MITLDQHLRGGRKPIRPSINRDLGESDGLIFACALAEQSGPIELLTNTLATVGGSPTFGPLVGLYGENRHGMTLTGEAGDDNWIEWPHRAEWEVDAGDAVSVMVWARSSDIGSDADGGLLSKGNDAAKWFGGAGNVAYELGVLNDVMYWQTSNGGTARSASATWTTYEDGLWHCWVGVHGNQVSAGGTVHKLYVDGAEVASVSGGSDAIQAEGGTLNIGGESGNAATQPEFGGDIDSAYVWNRGLEAEEITRLARDMDYLLADTLVWQVPDVPAAAAAAGGPLIGGKLTRSNLIGGRLAA